MRFMRLSVIGLMVLLTALAACGKKEEKAKRSERTVNVTVANVTRKDIPVTESAVGSETAVIAALGYDPTSVGSRTAYIRLPFPENVATRLKRGQTVTLNNFSQPEQTVRGQIQDIRPALTATTISREVIVAVPPTRGWQPQGSVRGEVVLDVRRNAVIVPEQAVVLRPAGTVVYIVEGEDEDVKVKQQVIKTGIIRNGLVEVTDGLKGNEKVAADGAAQLSDGAKVRVREAKS